MSGVVREQPPGRPDDYHDQAREDLTRALRRPLGAVLDVGCGSGRVGSALRAWGATRLVGIEVDPAAAEAARHRYDVVLEGSAEDVLNQCGDRFDTILCYDVLEHLVRPGHVLGRLRDLVQPDGVLHVSVPNARHIALVRDLVGRGTFGYAAWGHRDATHLRWFTRSDMEELLERTGWRVAQVASSVVGRSALVDRWSLGHMREFLALQWQFMAVPGAARGNEPSTLF